jgi:hypothetical protein
MSFPAGRTIRGRWPTQAVFWLEWGSSGWPASIAHFGGWPTFDFSLRALSRLRLPHLPRFSEGGHHDLDFLFIRLHRLGARMKAEAPLSQAPDTHRPWFPRFENREAWGSLYYDGADRNQRWASPRGQWVGPLCPNEHQVQ